MMFFVPSFIEKTLLKLDQKSVIYGAKSDQMRKPQSAKSSLEAAEKYSPVSVKRKVK